MEPETAIGKRLTFWGHKGMIIGVVKDFNFKPVQQAIEPLVLRMNPWGAIAVVRAKPGRIECYDRSNGKDLQGTQSGVSLLLQLYR